MLPHQLVELVFLNGKELPVNNFEDYVYMYIKNDEDASDNLVDVIYENVNERWEVALTVSEIGFTQISYVNSIATTKGEKHVDYVVDTITKHSVETLNKQNKGSFVWESKVGLVGLIANPTFDSQTKEHMTLQVKNFGSKCPLSDNFFDKVTKSSLMEAILEWAQAKAKVELSKTSGKKIAELKGIPKVEDAIEAGGKDASKCTLILPEGDSAKSSVVSGLGLVGRDYYGVFPLRGKLLNVCEATLQQIVENAEIKKNLVEILECMTENMLLKQILPFYSIPEFEEWKKTTSNYNTYVVKYYKGLGTSSSNDLVLALDVPKPLWYLTEGTSLKYGMSSHYSFHYNGHQDDDYIVLAFSKEHVK